MKEHFEDLVIYQALDLKDEQWYINEIKNESEKFDLRAIYFKDYLSRKNLYDDKHL
jgi:hypothetical protein